MSHTWPDHLLSLAEWSELPRDPSHRMELVEGVLLVVPRATLLHQSAMHALCSMLKGQLPPGLHPVGDCEVVLTSGDGPGQLATVRAPDVIVVPSELVRANRPRVDAADVRLAIEIHSPGTARTDKVTKMFEYADAGIPAYWLVDIDTPTTVTAYALVDGEYELVADTADRLEVLTPFPVDIDVSAITEV